MMLMTFKCYINIKTLINLKIIIMLVQIFVGQKQQY